MPLFSIDGIFTQDSSLYTQYPMYGAHTPPINKIRSYRGVRGMKNLFCLNQACTCRCSLTMHQPIVGQTDWFNPAMNLFLLGLTCSEWPAQALRLQNASSCLHYPGACIITTLSATHRPCYPAASQYLHKEPQVLRLRCPVPSDRHHAMSRPLQSQRSRHISCLTASLLPCVFLIGTAHNKLRFAPFPLRAIFI